MKGLILSGGKGTRLYPLTFTSAKQLIPVANKPVLFRVIEAIRAANIEEIGIVVGNNGHEIQDAVDRANFADVKITYIHQPDPLGLAHAVKVSADFLGNDRFVMFLGDNVIQGGISPLIAQFANSDWNSQIVLTRIEHPEQYGVAQLDERGHIQRLIEKPKNPPSNLALVGIYMFDHHIMEAVQAIKPSWRGELEITDAIQWLVDQGLAVHPYIHEGWWIDTGRPDDMLAANNLVLEELEYVNEGVVDQNSKVGRRVKIEPGAEIINSIVRGPTIIGQNTRIVNSYIGPYTSIYHHVLIENAEIEHSMVLENSRIQNLPTRIQDSLIGRSVVINRAPSRPQAMKLTLGDYSQVGIL